MVVSHGNSNTEHTVLALSSRKELICRGLQEVLGGEERVERLLGEKSCPTIYWGTAITGRPHVGYLVPMAKIADFIRAGCKVKILFADLHGLLDNLKSPWELIEKRTKYYQALITETLTAMNVDVSQLEFVKGTDYQLSAEYTLDFYKMATATSIRNATKAGAAVVKQAESPLLSSVMYPLLQCLDEKYLEVDAQFGGVDQRKIFALAEESMQRKVVHLMNPMIPGLNNAKMSSSDEDSKIDLLDSPAQIQKKLSRSFFDPETCEESALLLLIKHTVMLIESDGSFCIERCQENGGNVQFQNFDQLVTACKSGSVHPSDLKNALASYFAKLLACVREKFQTPDMQKLTREAYPSSATNGSSKSAASNAAASIEPSLLRLKIGKIEAADDATGKLTINLGSTDAKHVALVPFNRQFEDHSFMLGKKFVFIENIRVKSQKISKAEENVYCEMLTGQSFSEGASSDQQLIERLSVGADFSEGQTVHFADHAGQTPHEEINRKKAYSKLQKNFKLIASNKSIKWKDSVLVDDHGKPVDFPCL